MKFFPENKKATLDDMRAVDWSFENPVPYLQNKFKEAQEAKASKEKIPNQNAKTDDSKVVTSYRRR